MILHFLTVREVIYRQVRFEFQMVMENRDGKDGLLKFLPLQMSDCALWCMCSLAANGQSSSTHSAVSLGRMLNSQIHSKFFCI